MSDASSDKGELIRKGWGIPGALFLGVSAYFLPQVIVMFFLPGIQGLLLSPNYTNFLVMALFELLVIGTILIFAKGYGLGLKDLGLKGFKLSHLGLVVLGFFVYFAASVLLSAVAQLFIGFDQEQVQDIGFTNPAGAELLLVFVSLIILAPFAEELLFRGFVYRGFRRRLSFWVSAVLVSALFGLVHGQVNVGLDVFALSMVLCWLREKTDSLWPSIILHAGKNAVAFLLLFVFKVV